MSLRADVWPIGAGAELRRLTVDDAGPLFALVDRNRDRLRPWMPWVDDVGRPVDVARFVADSLRPTEHGPFAHELGFVVDGALGGALGLNRLDWHHRTANVGYWVDSGLEGRGIVTRGTQRLVRHAFEELGLARVELRAAVDNVRSQRVALRAGFRREGVLRSAETTPRGRRDVVIFGILPSDVGDLASSP